MNWLREAFREHGSRPAVIEDGRTWTYRELDALADRPPPGPVLATWMPPGASHAILLLQALAAGMPIAPLHFRLPIGEAIRLAASLGARQLFTADGPQAVEPIGLAPESPLATLLFTSGSTGQPRCVAHTLEAHLASAQASASRIPLRPGHVWHVQLPLSHVSGLAILLRCARAGAAALFGKGEATHVSMVPTQLHRALPAAPPSRHECLLLGGAAADPSMVSQAVRLGWPIHLTYGLTEMASQVCTTQRLGPADDARSVGQPLPTIELRLCGRQIAIRGPMLAAGSWTASGLQPLAPPEGWFLTSDLGSPLPDGSWLITGRADRVIISGGENISPEPIEAALEALPGIERAIILPIADPEFGQRPIAFIRGTPPPNWKNLLLSAFPAFAMPIRILPLPPHIAEGHQKLSQADRLALLKSLQPHP